MTRDELFARERRQFAMAPTGCNTGCIACALLTVATVGAVVLALLKLARWARG